MTASPEPKLGREAEICYAVQACVIDYGCWRPQVETVTAKMIMRNLAKNAALAQKVVRMALERLPVQRDCECAHALEGAIVTSMALVPTETKQMLEPVICNYVSAEARKW